MTNLCPKPCSRLATAAIFIIIGVVQLLAGVILLRSKYADLLSGPDFMTGSSNIAIGCIYGTISSIWKINNKKKSAKITARKNVLAALMLSVITVNATAAIILIMGNGNRLLNLYLENNKHKIDFASEILAYAYICSAFTPIFCIVVALVILSGRCIEICRDISTEKAKNSIANDDCYNWVFDPKTKGVKVICDTTETSSDSTSASEDSVFTEEDNSYSRQKSVLCIKNVPSPINMWKEKRERIQNDVNWSSKQPRLNLVLEKPDFYDCSHERLIPRIKESSLKRDLNPKLGDLGKKSSKAFKSILKRSSSSPVSRGAGFHEGNPASNAVKTRCIYDCEQENDYEDQENSFRGYLRARKTTSSNRNKASKFTRSKGQSLSRAESIDCEETHFIDPIISKLKAETLRELKQKVSKILPGSSSTAVIQLQNNCGNQKCMSEVPLRNSEDLSKESHYPEVSRYKLFTNCSGSSSSAGKQLLSDRTSESYHMSSYSPENSPLTQSAYKNKGTKTGFSAISKIRSKSFEYSNEEEVFPNQDETKFSSMLIVDEKKSFPLDYQKISSSKQNRKFDTSRKMSMASIAEILSEDDYYSERESFCSTSDFGDNSQMTDENSNRLKMSSSSKRIHLTKASRRKSSLTSNKLIKRMWSSSEPKINVSDLIVDEDSLIGLSEEELVARTFRIRSLRKTVEDRLKKKKEAEKIKNTYSNAQ